MQSEVTIENEVTAAAAPPTRRHDVVIVGGGAAGLAVAARLRRAGRGLDVALVEPSERHFYQPLWTLVGGGVLPKERTLRAEADLVPQGVTWLKTAAAAFEPDENVVVTADGDRVGYDALVVAPGIRLDWQGVDGLADAVGTDGVCSIWAWEQVDRAWETIRSFEGGTAVFTFPSTPIKCPGAAQKIMYLADSTFRRRGVRDRTRIVFVSAAPRIFGVDKYAATLQKVVERKGIETLFRHELVGVDSSSGTARVRGLDGGEELAIPYELLHVAPPQRAPAFVEASPLAGEKGWVDVDPATLQHVRWPNVFSLGDASSLPTSKTGAAIRAQAPIVTRNLLAFLAGREPEPLYWGYTACPLVTDYGKLVLAEFDYDCQPRETFPFDQSKERLSMYLLKKHLLPQLYWHGILRGRA